MNIGDVILYRKNESFISRAIAFITSSSYTHAGIVYDIQGETNTLIIAEALMQGFTKVEYNFDEFLSGKSDGKYLVRRSKIYLLEKKIKESIDKYIGRPYGFLDLVKCFIWRISKKDIFSDNAKSLICSEAVSRCLYDASNKKIDFEKEFKKKFDTITPDDLSMTKQLRNV